MSARIKWEEIAKLMGYESDRAMFDDLYVSKRIGSTRIARKITFRCKGHPVSNIAVLFKIRNLGYEIKARGGCNNQKMYQKYGIDCIRCISADLTILDISNYFGITQTNSYIFCKNNGLSFKKMRLKNKDTGIYLVFYRY